ncbi:MAG TPA: bifunctional demethylmenaquinone methyltransferase/2-methoxy-6-polyprenyl-1,4-benzoquinol methylase UbiE [Gaiellales bacterium]
MSGTLEPREVERMFDRIAGPYDTMNRVMTAGLDRRWRELAAAATGLGNGATVLDACCGTGDLALALARQVGRVGHVTGLDFSGEMLERARRKPRAAAAAEVTWVQGDAMHMPFPDDSFAAVTIGFGLRNLPDVEGGLRELARVVRPGGRVVVLEITQPSSGPLKPFYGVWFKRVVPALGRALDSSAYSYLPASVARFPGPEALGDLFWKAGMRDVRYRLLASGIVALHTGEVV